MVQGKHISNPKLGYQIALKQTKSHKQLRNRILYVISEHEPHQFDMPSPITDKL